MPSPPRDCKADVPPANHCSVERCGKVARLLPLELERQRLPPSQETGEVCSPRKWLIAPANLYSPAREGAEDP